MTAKKKLGMGLDLLLSAVENRSVQTNENKVPAEIRSMYEAAVDQDEKGNYFEAYYLYRKVTESQEILTNQKLSGIQAMVSQAYNNLGVILFDNNRSEQALEYLKKAIEIWPENETAKENLEAIER